MLHEFDLDRIKMDIVQVEELIERHQALLDVETDSAQAEALRDRLVELRQELAQLNGYLG